MNTSGTSIKTDELGNTLIVEGNVIYLETASNKKQERLGSFNLDSKQLIINKEHFDYDERFKCYPFNEALLKAAKKCDTVLLKCPEGRFVIPISVILEYATPLIYKKPGLSKEIFLSIDVIKKYHAGTTGS